MSRAFISIASLLAVSACSAGTGGIPAASTSASAPATAPSPKAPQPRVMRGEGVDSVVGESAAALLNRFGTARIDLTEGDARKLQFTSQSCVLDIYFYPTSADAQPVATHIEARERSVGAPFDRAACIAAVEQSVRIGG